MKIVTFIFIGLLLTGILWFFWQQGKFKNLTASYVNQVLALRASGEVQVPSILMRELKRNNNVSPQAVAIRIIQKGVIRTSLDSSWKSFEAEQTIALGQSGFVWLATMPIFAGQGVEVIDSYDGQAGFLQVRILGALTLDSYEGPEADSAELQRYLAELPMAPGAMALNANLKYDVQSDGSVRIWDKTVGEHIWVEALLDQKGRISEIRTDKRARGDKGGSVMTPWGGAYSDYTIIDGYEVPRKGEVWWVIEGKKSPYWRGEIISITALDETGKPISPK